MIRDVRDRHSDVIFLAEAFTRPAMMRRLAKIGFSQSYSYFTWRNTKHEFIEYLTELTQSPMREYYQPNFFVNTPDINPIPLQTSGRPGFQIRAVLAATLSTVWGLYSGFELCEGTPLPGREEYMDSEKYQLRAWDWDRPGNIRDDIARLNRLRRENPALRQFTNLRFFTVHSDSILFYGKMTPERDNIIWIAVSLDPHHLAAGHLVLPLDEAGLPHDRPFDVDDLSTGRREQWLGSDYYLRLEPSNPYRIWRVGARP
jgi:starch synthase (maltosyl-transferring)